MTTENPDRAPLVSRRNDLQVSLELLGQLLGQVRANLEVTNSLMQVYIKSNESVVAMGEQVCKALEENRTRQQCQGDASSP